MRYVRIVYYRHRPGALQGCARHRRRQCKKCRSGALHRPAGLESNKGLLEEEVVSEFDLQTARNEVMEAEAVLQSSRLAFLPFVSLGGQGK